MKRVFINLFDNALEAMAENPAKKSASATPLRCARRIRAHRNRRHRPGFSRGIPGQHVSCRIFRPGREEPGSAWRLCARLFPTTTEIYARNPIPRRHQNHYRFALVQRNVRNPPESALFAVPMRFRSDQFCLEIVSAHNKSSMIRPA